MNAKPELIAPAGNMDCALAAVANGADAVYFGLQQFNARMRADNFTAEQLPELVAFLHVHNVKGYCTVNTLVFAGELPEAERALLQLDAAGVDAVIIQDLGLAALARALGLRMEVHASTQMTITSPEGVRFAQRLGVTRVVVARETSLKELAHFGCSASAPLATDPTTAGGAVAPQSRSDVGLEVFVHGALCVAYSGQCLTSEALGQRSANRGECAQACRLPYQLIVDGALKDLGDRRYLLSPQDLAAVEQIPELVRLGVRGFKIEGRLKTPEYVAATCQVYRKAIDAAWEGESCRGASAKRSSDREDPRLTQAQLQPITDDDRYKLEMTFSRGLYSGWLQGVNHQQLVHARFGKKRGPFVGFIKQVGMDFVELEGHAPSWPHSSPDAADGRAEARPSDKPPRLRPGDGVVFDTGGDPDREQGGRVWEVQEHRLFFERGHIDFGKLKAGDRVWKTSDPQLQRALRQTFRGEISRPKTPLDITVTGAVGLPLTIEADGARVHSAMSLQTAYKRPLTRKSLADQLGRLGETGFVLGEVHNRLVGQVILPVGELNRMRRQLVGKIESTRGNDSSIDRPGTNSITAGPRIESRQECCSYRDLLPVRDPQPGTEAPRLIALCRTTGQIQAALDVGCDSVYLDFEDIRRYVDAVAFVRDRSSHIPLGPSVYLATPRIQKVGERGFFKVIEQAAPDGVLVRNLGALEYFRNKNAQRTGASYRLVGDFSLNVANPVTADLLVREGIERLTVSYDLNANEVLDLLRTAPPPWFELTIHQHMPMFHMEHCVFAAFLSEGTDATNCGRPCDVHNLKLRDRVGMEHPVKADVGCRNTVFHARAQSGAEFVRKFLDAGARVFRVELLDEDASLAKRVLQSYRALLEGTNTDASELTRRVNAVRQLGVTSGTLTVLGQGGV